MKLTWRIAIISLVLLSPAFAQANVERLPKKGGSESTVRPPPIPQPAQVDSMPGPSAPSRGPVEPPTPPRAGPAAAKAPQSASVKPIQPAPKGPKPTANVPAEPAAATAATAGTPAACSEVHLELTQDCLKAEKAQYAYTVGSLENRRQNFEWQLRSTKWIFFVVLLLVASGIGFAGFQLYVVMNAVKAGSRGRRRAAEGEAAPNLGGDIEISSDRIKISSSVLGVIILALAMAFFYLYARYVYPITEIGPSSQ